MKRATREDLTAAVDEIERETVQVVVTLVNATAAAKELELVTRGRDFQIMSAPARFHLESLDRDARIRAFEWIGLLVRKSGFLGKLEADGFSELQAAQVRVSSADELGRRAFEELFPNVGNREVRTDDIRELRNRLGAEREKLADGRLLAAHPFSDEVGNASQLTIHETRRVLDAVHADVVRVISVLNREHRINLEMGLKWEATQVVRPVVNALVFGSDAWARLRGVDRSEVLDAMHTAHDEGRIRPHFNSGVMLFLPRR